jgi:hypothetical protein
MPLLVHITAEKNVRSMKRTGIKQGLAGVYCMPVLQDYFISHQWLREMKRHRPGMLVAVYFRVSSQELVRVGHYSARSQQVTLAEAIQTIMTVADPQGYQIIIPRSIAPEEIHKVCHLRQIVGWRYMPYSHGKPFCTCPSCIRRGQIKGRKLREYYEDALRNNTTSLKGSKKETV